MALSTLNILTLKNLSGIGDKTVLKIGNHILTKSDPSVSASDLLAALKEVKSKCAVTLDDIFDAESNANRVLDKCYKDSIGVIGYYDDIFPERLRDCVDDNGKVTPSVCLFYKGDISILSMPMVAIIGSREILPEGEKAGCYLGGEFAKRGFCIVSGLALGCDTAGHRGALDVDGKTLAFLAHGLDTVYPPQNKDLADEIVDKGGLLMSEYPIGEPINKYYLVARDRLQAGISQATVVIHTGVDGGTMHAANATLQSNKPLYVVKFQRDDTMNNVKCLGNNLLVKKGAKYISGADSIDKICDEIINSSNTLF